MRDAVAARYDVREQLGGGVMARVFLATDRLSGRAVALKVLRPEVRSLLGAERFVQEIAIVAAFDHPGIVPLLESDDAGGFLYFAMRYIQGESLDARIRRERRLPVDDAIRIAAQVARALDYSHRRSVVHRDVKPRNILLREHTALIADFGTAIITVRGGRRLTESGVLVGTPEYMSPEQAESGGRADGRSDVYGLGCVLYEMVTGEPVYTGATIPALLAKHRAERVPSLRVIRREAPEALDRIVRTALAKHPGDRFAGAAALAEALERI